MQDDEKPNPETPKDPAHQTDETHGSIKSAQVTKADMKRQDVARGSEPDTRGSSRNRN